MEQRWERRERCAGTGPGGAGFGGLGVGVSTQAAAGRGHVAGTDSERSSDVDLSSKCCACASQCVLHSKMEVRGKDAAQGESPSIAACHATLSRSSLHSFAWRYCSCS